MSSQKLFPGTAHAAVALYEDWARAARLYAMTGHAPSLITLQTVCRQTGCVLPDLDSFVRAGAQPRPGFLLSGGTAELANELAALLGLPSSFMEPSRRSIIWSLDRGDPKIRIRSGDETQTVTESDIPAAIESLPPNDETIRIEELADVPVDWRFLWVPYPELFQAPDCTPVEIEALLSQRAALVLESTPPFLQKIFEGLGQKLWMISQDQLSIEPEKDRLFAEIATLREDSPEELELRAAAAWTWLVGRLIEQIEYKKRSYQHITNQYEIRLSSTKHLLAQYAKNWTSGVRSLAESYVQNRTSSQAFANLLDVAKPGPETSSFMAAMGLQALWTKLDEFVMDRMADFVAGLTGLAAKLDLRQISLGDAKARWVVRQLNSKLEAELNSKKIFPTGGGKRGTLVGNLTGRKQVVIDERKGQILKAARAMVQFIEAEFASWAAALISTIENGINLQLAAALANQGFADVDSLKSATDGLSRLSDLIQGKEATARSPEDAAVEWLRLIASRRWIPLYQTT